MRMDVYNEVGDRVATVAVDPASPPGVVHGHAADGSTEEHYLDWDRTFDDDGHLRKCPVCGCDDLFQRRAIPALTGFIVVLAVGLVCLALWGLTEAPLGWMLGVLVAVVVVNVLIVMMAGRYVQCYRCASRFREIEVRAGRAEWEGAIAERYRGERSRSSDADAE